MNRPIILRLLPLLALLLWGTSAAAQLQGLALIDSMKRQLPRVVQDTARVNLLLRIANNYATVNPDSGATYCTAALKAARAAGYSKGVASAYNVLGICEIIRSNYKAAINYWNTALPIFKEQNDKQGILKVIGNLGGVYQYQGDYPSALQHYFEALKYAEELGDLRSVAINSGNIGTAYEELGAYGKALDYYKKAERMCREQGMHAFHATYLGNIGIVYRDMQQHDRALQCLDSSLAENRALENTEGILRDMVNIGAVYEGMHNYERALSYYRQTLAQARDIGMKMAASKALLCMGNTYLALARMREDSMKAIIRNLPADYGLHPAKDRLLAEAISSYRQSLAIDSAAGELKTLHQTYFSLAAAQELKGDLVGALENYKHYTRLKDSVLSSESRIRITNLETQRELELKDKQIIIDKLEVAKKRNERIFFIAGFLLLILVVVIIIRNIRLSTARELSENRLSAFQARMNPHFIFNSLSSIQSLIMNDERDLSVDYLSEFSSLMRQILDNSAQGTITLRSEVNMLRSYIELERLRFGNFKSEITIAPDINPDAVNIPGMIIQPFAENAILHGIMSKGEAGILNIHFAQTSKQIICTVEDNGIGRAAAEALKANRPGRKSHGTSIAINRLTLLNDKKRGLTNRVMYEDKIANGIPLGTKAIIELPRM